MSDYNMDPREQQDYIRKAVVEAGRLKGSIKVSDGLLMSYVHFSSLRRI